MVTNFPNLVFLLNFLLRIFVLNETNVKDAPEILGVNKRFSIL